MQDELRLSLLIAGSCFIIAVLAHGIWKIRKNNQTTPSKRQEPRAWHEQEDDHADEGDSEENWRASPYDDLGLGEVRVVNHSRDTAADDSETDTDTATSSQPGTGDNELNDEQTEADKAVAETSEVEDAPFDDSDAVNEPDPAQEKLYGSVVSNPKPHMQSHKSSQSQEENPDFPEPPGFLIKDHQQQDAETPATSKKDDEEVDSFSLDAQPAEPPADESKQHSGLSEQAKKLVSRKRNRHSVQKRRQEPNFGDDQMRIDFDEQQVAPAQEDGAERTQSSQQTTANQTEQEVLVLNVRAKADEPISGAALLPLLLTLGFKFGDQDIFHRHVNSNGKGPVLFSLANMFKPGNFDIDNLENFTTQGVSLFMILPIEGDPHQVFTMMQNAGRKIADEFGAQILDGRRSVLTKQGLQQYTQKIREFERQRMIARH